MIKFGGFLFPLFTNFLQKNLVITIEIMHGHHAMVHPEMSTNLRDGLFACIVKVLWFTLNLHFICPVLEKCWEFMRTKQVEEVQGSRAPRS